MNNYQELLRDVLQNGRRVSNRTGVDTLSLLGKQLRYDLGKDGFPAVTTKRLAWRAVVSELLWFLEGSTSERRLCEILHGSRQHDLTTIWTDNAKNQGVKLGYDGDQLGPVYGRQWRSFNGVDQLAVVRDQLKNDPQSRRIIISAWNPGQLAAMALPPCHMMSQFIVQDGKLNCIVTQRSCDIFLGVPFNIASYALLTHILAADATLEVGELIWNGGDVHLYENHIDAAHTQLKRVPRTSPLLAMLNEKYFSNYTVEHFKLLEYYPQSAIKAEMVI